MGKSMSIYLSDGALVLLEQIKAFFRRLGYEPSDSGIVTSAISTYAWWIEQKQSKPRCPNLACGEILNDYASTCPACGTPIKWIATSP